MAALSAPQNFVENAGDTGRGAVAASVKIQQGGMLGRTTAGYLRPFATGDFFAGHALEEADNSAGAAGAIRCRHRRGVYYATVPVFGSTTIAHVGDKVWTSSDNHADLTRTDPGSTLTTTDLVGYIHDIDPSGNVVIKFVCRDN